MSAAVRLLLPVGLTIGYELQYMSKPSIHALPSYDSIFNTAINLLLSHGMIDVAALHVLTTVTRRGWDAGVGACGSQAKLTTASASDRWREGDTGTVSR